MVAIKLWNFLKGYVIIKIEGLSIEKFLNLIMVNDVYIWDIERKNYTTIVAKVSLKGFKEIVSFAKKTNCRVSVISKKGLPFVISRLKRRKLLVLGAIVSLILIYAFSTFIWEINIETVNNVNEKVVLEKLSHLGLKPGVSKFAIDVNKIETEFLLQNNDISLSLIHI